MLIVIPIAFIVFGVTSFGYHKLFMINYFEEKKTVIKTSEYKRLCIFTFFYSNILLLEN